MIQTISVSLTGDELLVAILLCFAFIVDAFTIGMLIERYRLTGLWHPIPANYVAEQRRIAHE